MRQHIYVTRVEGAVSYINICPNRCDTKQSICYSASSLYMFRVSTTPIIRSTQNCNYSLRYYATTSLQRGQAWPRWTEVARVFKGFASLYGIKTGNTFIKMRYIITAILYYNLLARDHTWVSDLLLVFRWDLVTPSSGSRRKLQYSSTTLA